MNADATTPAVEATRSAAAAAAMAISSAAARLSGLTVNSIGNKLADVFSVNA
jgi:hypothetical protein